MISLERTLAKEQLADIHSSFLHFITAVFYEIRDRHRSKKDPAKYAEQDHELADGRV